MITAQTLRRIATNLTAQRAEQMAALLRAKNTEYSITTKDVFEDFLANVLHESGEFTIKAENLNYTTPQRLVAIWPSRFNLTGANGLANANNFVRNPRALANLVYNGRMGNRIGTDDGFNFRGGGFPQITGRDAYQRYADYKKRSIEEVANLVMTNDEWALDSAYWFFCIWKNLESFAVADNFNELVRRWNGGSIGMSDRLKYLDRCKRFL